MRGEARYKRQHQLYLIKHRTDLAYVKRDPQDKWHYSLVPNPMRASLFFSWGQVIGYLTVMLDGNLFDAASRRPAIREWAERGGLDPMAELERELELGDGEAPMNPFKPVRIVSVNPATAHQLFGTSDTEREAKVERPGDWYCWCQACGDQFASFNEKAVFCPECCGVAPERLNKLGKVETPKPELNVKSAPTAADLFS